MKAARLSGVIRHPHFQRYLHGTSTILALGLAAPIMVWGRESIAIVMAVSIWTWIEGAMASWLAAMAADPED